MAKEECRESRPVPFDPEGAAWVAAAAGAVRESVGVEVDALGRLLASPPRAGSVTQGLGLTPYQRQQPSSGCGTGRTAWCSVGSVRASVSLPSGVQRTPLAPSSGNTDVTVRVLSAEVRALELKAVALSERIKVQDHLIKGLCTEVAERAPPRHG